MTCGADWADEHTPDPPEPPDDEPPPPPPDPYFQYGALVRDLPDIANYRPN